MKFVKLFVLIVFGIYLLGSVYPQITTTVESGEGCSYRWFCTTWSPEECSESGFQTRTCTNAGDCQEEYNPPIEKRGCVHDSPQQLFDIKLELEEKIIYDSRDLTSWIRFENFGKEKTLVNLTYIIIDKKKNKVYEEQNSIEVETEKFVIKSFDSLDLSFGKYTLVLTTLYNTEVIDQFEQEFEIKNPKSLYQYLFFGFTFLLVFYFIVLLVKRYRRNKELQGIAKE